jgi:outer membrane protein OmpA-like peptidoglycan-associated protein
MTDHQETPEQIAQQLQLSQRLHRIVEHEHPHTELDEIRQLAERRRWRWQGSLRPRLAPVAAAALSILVVIGGLLIIRSQESDSPMPRVDVDALSVPPTTQRDPASDDRAAHRQRDATASMKAETSSPETTVPKTSPPETSSPATSPPAEDGGQAKTGASATSPPAEDGGQAKTGASATSPPAEDGGQAKTRRRKASREGKELALTVSLIPFESASDELSPEAKVLIDGTGLQIRKARAFFGSDMKVEIRGYTDTTGSSTNNTLLSQRRAGAVQLALLKGIPSAGFPVNARGFGEAHPRCLLEQRRNGFSIAKAMACNRRVEILIIAWQTDPVR